MQRMVIAGLMLILAGLMAFAVYEGAWVAVIVVPLVGAWLGAGFSMKRQYLSKGGDPSLFDMSYVLAGPLIGAAILRQERRSHGHS